MPKPTVTKLVQGLESHLRIKLLNRTTRRVTVTPDGSAYYERVVRLLGDLEDIESSVDAREGAAARPPAHRRGRGRVQHTHPAGAARVPREVSGHPRGMRRQRSSRGSHRRQRRLRDPRRPAARTVAGRAAHRRPALDHLRDARILREARRSPRTPPTSRSGHVLAGYFFPRSGRMRPLVFRARRQDASRSRRARASRSTTAARISPRCAPALGIGQLLSFMVSCSNANDELVSVLKDWQPDADARARALSRPIATCRPRCACSSTGPRSCLRRARARAC